MQGRLDGVAASRLDLVGSEIVGADVLQLAQVRVEVVLGGRRARLGLVRRLDVDVLATHRYKTFLSSSLTNVASKLECLPLSIFSNLIENIRLGLISLPQTLLLI